MSDCNFSLPFTVTAAALVAYMQTEVQNKGGTFSGDVNSGNFSVPVPAFGSISGTYAIWGQMLFIDISSKPFVVTCNEIENYVASHMPG
jgi:hypothetical protein